MINEKVPLGKHVKVEGGFAFQSAKFSENGIPIIRISNIIKGKIDTANCVKYPKESFENFKRYEVKEGDILIAMSGATTGKVGVFRKIEGKVLLNQRLGNFKIKNENNLLKEFLYRIVQSPEYQKKLKNIASGCAQPNISAKQLESIEVIIPPLPTQKKIVAILEKAEKLKGWRREADELTDELLKSTFLEMFGDPVKNQKGWEIVNLKTVFSNKKTGTKCGPFGSALKKYEYVNDGVPVWIMDNICESKFVKEGCLYITKEKYEKLKPYSVERGDILISRAGTVGKMCVANPSTQQSIISTNLIRLSLDSSKIEPIYFICLMTYFKGKMGKLKTGEDGAYTFMNTGILKELSIPLPPIKLQNKFIRLFEELELIQKHQTQSRQHIDDLFNALMQQAFRGELTT